MSWVKWLKGKSEGRETPATEAAAPRNPGRPRRNAEGAYAREWVKVLEDSNAERDPGGTYTWELQPDGPPRPASAVDSPARKRSAPREPYDTFTWELQESESPDDPWGLQQDDAGSAPKDVNPYDTGVFNASWTGRFDQR